MKKESKKTAALTMFQLIENVIDEVSLEISGLNAEDSVYAKALALRLGITPVEALLLAAIVEQSGSDPISLTVLASFFGVRLTKLLALSQQFEHLRQLGLIKVVRKARHVHARYFVPQSAIDALNNNLLPEPQITRVESVGQLLERFAEMMKELSDNSLTNDEFNVMLNELLINNRHINLVAYLVDKAYGQREQRLLLYMGSLYLNENEGSVSEFDLVSSELFTPMDLRLMVREMSLGTSPLILNNDVEAVGNQGMAEMKSWKLTAKACVELLEDADYASGCKKCSCRNLVNPDTLPEKQMFYSPDVEQQVSRLSNLLQPNNLSQVVERLRSRNFRQGFSCLFYGAPGTGKTETVYQLCRQTGHPLMMVNIASIRNKYVGETEQNIKRIFNNYRRAIEESEVMPVLVFNEADALFTRRTNGTRGVDKMENAMQNIILEEMEQLNGILIATTNLAANLDPAFERRFIYKIEFSRPQPEQSRHIWQSLIPSLTDEQSLQLAKQYPFSGGQIENIARKAIIDDALNLGNFDADPFNHIVDLCNTETLHTAKPRVGF